MSDDAKLLPDDYVPAETDVETSDTQSVLSSLRKLRSELGEDAPPITLEVPGYEGLLLVRYKWTPFGSLSKNAQQLKAIKDLPTQQVASACDVLIRAHDEVLVRVGDEVKPLAEDGVPVTFGDERLAAALGFEPAKTARDAVRKAFHNDYALITQANDVWEWLRDTSHEVDKGFFGS